MALEVVGEEMPCVYMSLASVYVLADVVPMSAVMKRGFWLFHENQM